MPVTLYSSAQASAPVLTGETGSLNALLSAILVTGYGTVAAAGWTKPYTDAITKTDVFRPAAGPMHHFQVEDGGPGAGTFREARIRGYVAMTALNIGTEPFPTTAQAANGQFIRKSVNLDTTPRPWRAVADDKTLYLGIDAGDVAGYYHWYAFGAFRSWKTADAYASLLAARLVENSASYSSATMALFTAYAAPTTISSIFAPRSYTGLGGAVQLGVSYNANLGTGVNQGPFGNVGITYPNPVDGGLVLSTAFVHELNLTRGTLPGLWLPCHAKPILHDDTFTVLDGTITRAFVAYNLSSNGMIMLETSNTWYND